MSDFIDGLPKCELHVHLEGTLEAGLQAAIARRNGLPDATGARPREFGDLATFLAVYYDAMSVLRTENDFADLTAAYLAKARSQGVVYCEMFFDPQAHTARGVPFDAVINGIHRAQVEAAESGGPRSELIMCFLRDHPLSSAWSTLSAALPYRSWILGVGLDSDERENPPAKFAELFARCRAEGFRITIHCDPNQDRSIDNIRECLDLIAVERIDHGVNCLEDDSVTAEIARRGLGLTICPLSNRQIYGDMMADKVAALLSAGILVTCNSDDPAYFGGYVADNLRAVEESGHISRSEVVQLVKNSFEVAWLSPELKADYLAEVDRYLASR